MTEFPLSPGLSRTVIFSASLGCADLVLAVAAMLSVENVFVTPGGKKNLSTATKAHKDLAEQAGGRNDFATLLYVYKQCHSRLVKLQKQQTLIVGSVKCEKAGLALVWRLPCSCTAFFQAFTAINFGYLSETNGLEFTLFEPDHVTWDRPCHQNCFIRHSCVKSESTYSRDKSVLKCMLYPPAQVRFSIGGERELSTCSNQVVHLETAANLCDSGRQTNIFFAICSAYFWLAKHSKTPNNWLHGKHWGPRGNKTRCFPWIQSLRTCSSRVQSEKAYESFKKANGKVSILQKTVLSCLLQLVTSTLVSWTLHSLASAENGAQHSSSTGNHFTKTSECKTIFPQDW